jgi:acyl-CoA thioester hydrolase
MRLGSPLAGATAPATPFIYEQLVAAKDLDGYGHVNNAVYPLWFDRCARAHSELLGLGTGLTEQGFGWVVVETHIRFKGEAVLGDTVSIVSWLEPSALAARGNRMFVASVRDKVVSEARYTFAFFDLSRHRATRMPDDLRIRLFNTA